MKIKLTELYTITKLVQDFQKREKKHEIVGLDTDMFLAEDAKGLWFSIKYFNLSGKEQIASVLIKAAHTKPLPENNMQASGPLRNKKHTDKPLNTP